MTGDEKRFAAIGECMIELSDLGDGNMTLAFGGDTLNTSVYLARLGARAGIAVDYVTALGDDPYSDQMIVGWRKEGVGTELVARLPGRLPGLYAIRTDTAGERSFYYWRSAAAARDLFKSAAAGGLAERLGGHDMLYLSGITLSILDNDSRAALMALVRQARGNGARIAFDSNYRPRGWPDTAEAQAVMNQMLRHVDIALPTLDDEQALFGVADADACIERMAALGVAEIVVKNGPQACAIRHDGRRVDVETDAVATPVDTTAAGDSFNAGYLATRLGGGDPEAAARNGHRLATEVIRHRGAIIPAAAMPDVSLAPNNPSPPASGGRGNRWLVSR